MVKMVARAVALLAVLGPAQAFAQLSIAGEVKDTSGAVLPGVTVEASSPALIEKTRSVVTDSNGQYQIVNLLPGTYAVSFTLTGFATVMREGVVLSGNTFTATVDTELRVGGVAETLTVTGEAPVVDVQNAVQQQTMNHELLTSIPAAGQFFTEAQLVPGVTLSNMPSGIDVGGTSGVPQAAVLSHGSRVMDFRLNVDNLSVGAGGAGFTMYMPNPFQTDEINFVTAGGLGEAETAGSAINMIPKSGGNQFTGSINFSGTSENFQGSNSDAALQALGFSNPTRIKKMVDFGPGIGGPIERDRLWFYTSYHIYYTQNWAAQSYSNLNAGNLDAWTYAPDFSHPSFLSDKYQAGSARVTFNLNQKNKFALYWDEQARCESCAGPYSGGPGASGVFTSSFRSPEATQYGRTWPDRVQQLTWSSPVTNKFLLQAGVGSEIENETTKARNDITGAANPLLISVLDIGGAYPGIIYRAPDEIRDHWDGQVTWKASASYVTGRHNAKVGYYYQYGKHYDRPSRPQNVRYFFVAGAPVQIEQFAYPYYLEESTHLTGLYAQDSITLQRFTLQAGVRYDRVTTSWPAQSVGPTGFTSLGQANVAAFPLMPNQIAFPAGQGLNLNDITPRFSAAYDLRGDGKTALKFQLGKYMQLVGLSLFPGAYDLNPISRLNFDTTRAWTPSLPPGSPNYYVPQCDLANLNANGDCGAVANSSFGQAQPYTYALANNVATGWGNRPYEWTMSVAVSHQLAPRVSVDVGYYRTWFGNFTLYKNLAISPNDYTSFNYTVPVDPRLSTGGGQTLTFLDINPEKFGLIQNELRQANDYGGITEHWSGVDLSVNVRPRKGLTAQAGFSSGVQSYNFCNVIHQVPEFLYQIASPVDDQTFAPVLPGQAPSQYCNQSTGVRTQVKGLASYTIPRIDVQVAGTYQHIPGALLSAIYFAPNEVVAPLLGRNLAGGSPFTALNLAEPGKQTQDSINQIDFRVSKRLQFGRTHLLVGVDFYNTFNTNTIQYSDTTYGPTYGNPLVIMPPRFVKFSSQFEF
jgi:hypothetical protein